MSTITEWMVENKIAQNGYAAGHIATGLKFGQINLYIGHVPNRNEEEAMCKLYRKWRPKTDKKNELLSVEVYQLVIAGIDPDDVEARQIEMFETVNAE